MKYFEKQREDMEHEHIDSYYPDMMKRINLQSIGGYIRSGEETNIIRRDNFKEREDKAYAKLEKALYDSFGDNVTDEILSSINEYKGAIEDIYFNMGMKAGAVLHSKLTDNFKTDV